MYLSREDVSILLSIGHESRLSVKGSPEDRRRRRGGAVGLAGALRLDNGKGERICRDRGLCHGPQHVHSLHRHAAHDTFKPCPADVSRKGAGKPTPRRRGKRRRKKKHKKTCFSSSNARAARERPTQKTAAGPRVVASTTTTTTTHKGLGARVEEVMPFRRLCLERGTRGGPWPSCLLSI